MVKIVILAGGVGSRLYPFSTPEYPKQFLPMIKYGSSDTRMISTLELLVHELIKVTPIVNSISDINNISIIAPSKYEKIIDGIVDPYVTLLDDVLSTGTYSAIIQSLDYIYNDRYHGDKQPDYIVFIPADIFLGSNTMDFFSGLKDILSTIPVTKSIITIGTQSRYPSTQYGYIQALISEEHSECITNMGENLPPVILPISHFHEKPDSDTAELYCADHQYFWNTGIFIISKHVSTQLLNPIYSEHGTLDSYIQKGASDLVGSFDVQVMEKRLSSHTDLMIPYLGFWSDLGTLQSIDYDLAHDETYFKPDQNGNIILNNIYDPHHDPTRIAINHKSHIFLCSKSNILMYQRE